MNGKNRAGIDIGSEVAIVPKEDQRTGTLAHGRVQAIRTKTPSHFHDL